ncbi:MAG: hypothetical protein PF542_04490 [Nanoarchaeota archaeon]|jgi:hypothetical protein|nr:hypothetical protein [Nanoarchaeota archaeon]
MTSDSKIFLWRGFGRILILGGFILTIYLPYKFQSFFGLIPGLCILLYGLYLTSKSDRRRGHIVYHGGRI